MKRRQQVEPPRKVATARTFASESAAIEWALQSGFSVGPAEGSRPRALVRGSVKVPAWRTLSGRRDEIDGRIAGDLLRGPIVVEVFA